MRYKNYKCDGCQQVFESDDDIVVCPDCATPQHRECYEKNGKCVNAHLHSENFQWQGERINNIDDEPVTETSNTSKESELLVCPNCQHKNPAGTTVCQNCGLKFTIFGFNLAQAVQDQEEEKKDMVNTGVEPKMTPPDYPPPFTVGSDSQQQEERKTLPLNEQEQMEEFLSHTISNASGFEVENQTESFAFKGPYPDEMKIEDISVNTLGAFISRNSEKYIRKFQKIVNGKFLSFNWAAFFFTPYWFFYRKLYKAGIIFMTAMFCISIIAFPYTSEFFEIYNNAIQALDVTDVAAIEGFYNSILASSAPIMIIGAINFILQLIAGFIANPLYKKYSFKHLREIESTPNRSSKLQRIIKYGGVSPITAILSIMAEQLLSMIASMFL